MSTKIGSSSLFSSDSILCIDPASIKSNIGNRSLINWDSWTAGTSGVTGYVLQTNPAENERLLDSDPWGNQSMVWKCKSDGTNGADGGWVASVTTSVNPSKTYRFSVWLRRTSTIASGYAYLGCWTNGTGNTYNISDSLSNTKPVFSSIYLG